MSTMPGSNFSPIFKSDVSKPKSQSIVSFSASESAQAMKKVKLARQQELQNSEKIAAKTQKFRNSAKRPDINVGNNIDVQA